MRRLLPHPILSALLLAVWLLANNSVSPGTVLLGLVLVVGIPLLTEPFWPDAPVIRRYGPIPRLLGVVAWDILAANVRVARLVLGPAHRLRPRFLLVPLEVEHPFAITTLAGIITLTPGTVSANLSGDRRTLLVHALSEEDAEGAVADIKARYERPLLEIFGC
jgi:multicomponent K+:H+ antiporter subunit E